MKNCEYYEELISRSLDDELSVEERKELAVHLAGCPKCSELWQLMADISGMMKNDMEELPEGLHENIMADIRRSEMIKKNAATAVGNGNKVKATVEKKVSKPVRKMLATAACLVIVVAAAIAINPSDRAEDVVLERSTASTTVANSDESAGAVPETAMESADADSITVVEATPTPTPTQTTGTTKSVVSTPKPSTDSSNVIITTPAPTADTFLSTPAPTPTPTSSSTTSIVVTPVPTSQPTQTPTPTENADPIPTEAPAAASVEEPEIIDDQDSGSTEAQTATVEENYDGTQELIVEVAEKVAPSRIFSMFPALSAISPEPVDEETDENAADAEIEEAELEITTEETVQPDPVQLDLMNKEKTDELMKLLIGVVDEDEQIDQETKAEMEAALAPDTAQLPEEQWDDSFVIKLIYNDIPCELTVQTYDGNVYFSIAELVIAPPAEDATGEGKSIEAPVPAPSPSVEPVEDVTASPEPTAEPEQSEAESTEEQEQESEYTPVWLLSKCSNKDFTSLITSIMKELAKH